MLDVLVRVVRSPIDYSGLLKVTELTLEEKIKEDDDIYSFIFSSPDLPHWKAGQHGIFTIPKKNIDGKKWRVFSIASNLEEKVIRISTVISSNPSSFKKNLLELKAGEKVKMRGPVGEMYIESKMRNVIGIAGGIGITPFRAIISDLAKQQSNLPFTLIYPATKEHVYKEDLEKWSALLPNLEIIYVNTPEEVNAELTKQVAVHGNNAYYLLSGTPKMIEALRHKLRSLHINRNRVLNDPFKGY